MNKQSKIGFWGGLSFRRTAVSGLMSSPGWVTSRPGRESILTIRSVGSCRSGGSTGAHEKLQTALLNVAREIQARQQLEFESNDRRVEMEQVAAQNRLYASKIKELTCELELLRKNRANTIGPADAGKSWHSRQGAKFNGPK